MWARGVNAIKSACRSVAKNANLRSGSACTSDCTQLGQCFIAGTLVLTTEELKSIEEIQVGDEVLAYEEETGEQAYKPVIRLFRNTTEEWYHIRVNGEEIVCTGGHPFYVLNAEEDRKFVEFEGVKASGTGTWICARELKVSDQVLLSEGSRGVIEQIEIQKLDSAETTYNFEVADFHTYYVSDNKVLVHNDCTFEYVDTVDDALTRAEQHLGSSQHYYVDKNGVVNRNILVSDSDPAKIVRFDIDLSTPHVQKMGMHLNLETYAKPFGTPGEKAIQNIHLFWRK